MMNPSGRTKELPSDKMLPYSGGQRNDEELVTCRALLTMGLMKAGSRWQW